MKVENQMENHKKSLILEWVKKYILMRDLKEKSPEVLSSCIKLLIVPFLVFYFIFTIYYVKGSIHDYNKLQALDGVINLSHYTQKSGKYGRKAVIDVHVISESKNVVYSVSSIDPSDPFYMNITEAEGQQVRVWYLPDNNNFYLIKFLHTNKFDSLSMVKKTRNKLVQQSNYAKFAFPFQLSLVLIVAIIVQLLLIRLEIFRNYNLYFVDERWDWQRPVKPIMSFRYFIVTCILLVWPFVSIYNVLFWLRSFTI